MYFFIFGGGVREASKGTSCTDLLGCSHCSCVPLHINIWEELNQMHRADKSFSVQSSFFLFRFTKSDSPRSSKSKPLCDLLMHKALVAHCIDASLLNTDISAGLSWIPRCTDYQAHVRPSLRKTKGHSCISCRMEKLSKERLTCVWWRLSQRGHRASLCYQCVCMICWPCWMDRPLLAESPLSLLFGLG